MIEREAGPIRTCIGCRKRGKKEDLLRFTVNAEGILVWDEKKEAEGRGFYLCPDRVCLQKAEKKRRQFGPFEIF